MDTIEFFKLLDILVWPITILLVIYILKPFLSQVLSGAKIKLSIAGQSIETTLPEIKQVLEEQAGESLDVTHLEYLRKLLSEGIKQCPAGEPNKKERKFLRPLRNAGLIQTVPKNAYLADAKAIEISGLGRLFMR